MSKEFIFEDGTTVPIKEFKAERHLRIWVSQPGRFPGESTNSVYVYVTQAVFDAEHKKRYNKVNIANADLLKDIQLGILSDTARIGIPAGAYVPLKWNAVMNRFEIFLTGLANDKLVLDESVASKDTIDKVNNNVTKDDTEVAA